MLRVPMPNAPLHLAKKVEAARLGQVSEIADQVCDRMLVTGAAVPLKNRYGLCRPGNVFDFICHNFPRLRRHADDDLAKVRARSHVLVSCLNFVETKYLVDHRLDPVRRNSTVHCLEHLRRADRNALHVGTAG
jgi:hypothetical protein